MSKIRIIRRDKKVVTNTVEEDGGDGGAAWLLLPLNIIPKKSPSSLDPALLPLLVAPVTVPPPLKPGYRSPLSLFNYSLMRTLRKLLFWFGRDMENKGNGK